jgi:putative hydrolase of the HAD superfamily
VTSYTTVLFDFSGTLLRIEPAESWLLAVLRETGTSMPEDDLVRAARELEEAGALPGGASPRELPGELAQAWAVRDRTAELHRALYTGLSRRVDLPDPALHDALYDRHMTPAAWQSYPDALEVLRAVSAHMGSTPMSTPAPCRSSTESRNRSRSSSASPSTPWTRSPRGR